jgi:hypothetical protein
MKPGSVSAQQRGIGNAVEFKRAFLARAVLQPLLPLRGRQLVDLAIERLD